jgi:hypothetical protein
VAYQMIFLNYASGAVAPPEAVLVRVGDAIWQWAQRPGLVQCPARAVRAAEVFVLAQHGRQVLLVPDQVRSGTSGRQLPVRRSMIGFICGV